MANFKLGRTGRPAHLIGGLNRREFMKRPALLLTAATMPAAASRS
jgi:hypothetical protein